MFNLIPILHVVSFYTTSHININQLTTIQNTKQTLCTHISIKLTLQLCRKKCAVWHILYVSLHYSQ